MQRHGAVVVLSLCLLIPTVAGQVSGYITPNPAPPGASVTLTVTDSSGLGFQYYPTCSTMNANVPNGPIVPIALPFCGPYTTVPPYGTVTHTLPTLNSMAPGIYYMSFNYSPIGAGQVNGWFPFAVAGPTDPVLSAGPAQVGQPLNLTLNAPGAVFDLYYVAGSFTTYTGLVTGLNYNLVLDFDFFFDLTFPFPLPGLFTNFQGATDGNGLASNIVMNLPADPAIAHFGFHFQALVQSVTLGTIRLSTPIGVTIQ